MQKIISLCVRNYDVDRLVRDEPDPDYDDDEWYEFPESNGLVDSYRLYEFPEELIDLGELL